jgi:hypothetical protein
MIIHVLQKVIDLGVGVFGLFAFALLALVAELGFRIGRERAQAAATPDRAIAGVSTLTTGMLGLVAFTLALTVNLAQDRFETRRHATLEEANTIGTAWLRAGLAGEAGKPIAAQIEAYARGRLAYLAAATPNAAAAALVRTNALQTDIWRRMLPLLSAMPAPLASALVSSVNDMFDASLAQQTAMESRVPAETELMLLGGAMLAIGALGYQMGFTGRRQLVLALLLLAMLSGGMVLVIDFNRPRSGLTRVDTAPLVWTIQGFAPASP